MYYIICIIVIVIIGIIIFTFIKCKGSSNTKNDKNHTSPTYTVTVNLKNNSSNKTIEPFSLENELNSQLTIKAYYDELEQIKQLYKQRDTDTIALTQCIDICCHNINFFPFTLEAMKYNPPYSMPAFERLAIVYEKQQQIQDALEIANLQAYFSYTDEIQNRISRLSKKVINNNNDKSTGNTWLKYHFKEIEKLQGNLQQRSEQICDIIVQSDFKFDTLSKFVEDYVVLDVETTGLNYHYDAIVEIGCIRFRNNKEVARFNTLINPNMPIPAPATEIHNITDEMVKDAPYIDEKLQDLLNFIGDDVVIGHNIGFDIRFVINACLWAFIPYQKFKAIDTLALARKYISKIDITDYSLDTIRQFLHIDQPAHRALNDCCASAKLYQYCMNLNNQEQQHT